MTKKKTIKTSREPSYVVKGKRSLHDELFNKESKDAPLEKLVTYKKAQVNDFSHSSAKKVPVVIVNTKTTNELQKIANKYGKINKRGKRTSTPEEQSEAFYAINELKNRKKGNRQIQVMDINKPGQPSYFGKVKIGSSFDPLADKQGLTHPRTKTNKVPKAPRLGKKTKT